MFDYHVHTSFSADCDIAMETMVESALEKDIKEIAFTDHIDYDYPDKNISFLLDFENYLENIQKCRQKYKNIKILSGVEIGVQKHIIEKCKKIVTDYDFDFIICSLHAADKKDLHNGEYFIDKSPIDIYYTYYEELLYCIQNFNSYSVIGHMNLIDRYAKYMKKPLRFLDYLDIVEEIFKHLIYNGKGIEINTSSFKYGLNETIPSKAMLQLYKDLGGEIITIGSDAHTPDYLTYKFDYVYELINQMGFKYIASFDKLKPSFHKIG